MTRMVLVSVCFVVFSWSSARMAAAEPANPDLNAEFVNNYDGDTLTVNLPSVRDADPDGSMEVFWKDISVRVRGIDTPEIKGDCKAESKKAAEAQKLVQGWIKNGKSLVLMNVSRDKYFRLLADVVVDGESIGDKLLEMGIAVAYDGGTKLKSWCN